MKKGFLTGCLLAALSTLAAMAQNGEQIIRRMHDRYAGKWHTSFRFIQETGFYNNDSLVRTNTWYESAQFPFDLRIDVDAPNSGNATIYRKDSTYRYQNGKLVRTTAGGNPFVFLIGGMYCMQFDDVKKQLQVDGFDLSKGHTTNWKGRGTFVVGANAGDTASKQIWVDAENLYIVRYLERTRSGVMDVHMSNQVRIGEGWSETWVAFYNNGKLRQTEKYRDLEANPVLDKKIFEGY